MSDKEALRVFVMAGIVSETMTIKEAAQALTLSERQVKRLKRGVKESGVAFLAHKNRGRKPKHAIPDSVRQQVLALANDPVYRNVNYSHFTDLLAERHGIYLSVSSVSRVLRATGIKSSRTHRKPKHHRSRPRKPQVGMLLQIDASPHAWLENRGPRFCLVAAIDDATGLVVGATFRYQEDLDGYFEVLRQVISSYGTPLAIYHDGHSIFRSPKADELTIEQQLAGQPTPLTQLGRALSELQIGRILALSPEAKGRIERLWETLQDRLVIELRLAHANTIEEANVFLSKYLQRHNRRFAVQAKEPSSAFRPAPTPQGLRQILCRKAQRIVSNGSTISYGGRTYQLVDHNGVVPLRPHTKVTVHIHSDDTLQVIYREKLYATRELSRPLPELQPESPKKRAGLVSPRKPAPDHPWRRPFCLSSNPANHEVYRNHYTRSGSDEVLTANPETSESSRSSAP